MPPQPDALLTFTRFLYSGLPLFVLAAAILRFRLPLITAGLLSCLTALLLGFSFLGANPLLLLYAVGKGAAFTGFIALFLISAILFFHVVTELGVIDAMGKRLLFLAYRPLLQVLVIAWCFAGFMEGIVGFAIPVILVSPLLIAGGVPPFKAVALTLVGHAWAVTYGTVGVALFILSLSSRIPLADLTFWVAVQIGLAFVLTGFAVAHIYGGWRAVREGTVHILVAGAGTVTVFFILTFAGIPQLSAIVGGIVGAVLLIITDSVLCKRALQVPFTLCWPLTLACLAHSSPVPTPTPISCLACSSTALQ
ncbi:MAG: L-lactate permease [Clostridiales bacterium]|jgi:lactate permease|nr:L-lactate permease [Clostridiales bacterium]